MPNARMNNCSRKFDWSVVLDATSHQPRNYTIAVRIHLTKWAITQTTTINCDFHPLKALMNLSATFRPTIDLEFSAVFFSAFWIIHPTLFIYSAINNELAKLPGTLTAFSLRLPFACWPATISVNPAAACASQRNVQMTGNASP